MLNQEQLHDRLVALRNHLDNHRWYKKLHTSFVEGDEGGCIIQHINRTGFDWVNHTTEENLDYAANNSQIREYLLQFLPDTFDKNDCACVISPLACWNDHFATFEQVCEVVDQAINSTAPNPDVSFITDAPSVERQREDTTLLSA
jgi:hypothetical protein